MSTVLLLGKQGLLRDLLRQRLESQAVPSVVEVEPAAAFDSKLPCPSVIVLVLEELDEAAERLITALPQRYAAAPICVISGRDDRRIAHQLVNLGVHGLISAHSCAESLAPALRLLAADEIFASEPSQAATIGASADDQPHTVLGHGLDESGMLTSRERQVAQVLFRGKSNKEIARELSIRENTVKIHVRNILKKLGVHSRSQAIVVSQGGINVHQS